MKNLMLLCSLLFLCSFNLSGQEESFDPKNSIGLRTAYEFGSTQTPNGLPTLTTKGLFEYRRKISKKLSVETALSYSSYRQYVRDEFDPTFSKWVRVHNLQYQLGLRYEFIQKEKFNVYGNAGVQGQFALNKFDHNNHTGLYLGFGIEWKVSDRFSIDTGLQFKNYFNDAGKRQNLRTGAVNIGFNYKF